MRDEKLRRIEAGRFSDRMKTALRLVLDGTSYRAAGRECGVDFRDLHKNAKRLELDLMHLKAWRGSVGDRRAPARKLHLRRLAGRASIAPGLDFSEAGALGRP